MNSEGKYLTAESFGSNRVNATGNSLRKKQRWLLVESSSDSNNNTESSSSSSSSSALTVVQLIAPTGCYLSTDKYGKLSCDLVASSTSNADASCKFVLERINGGQWAIRSLLYGYYLSGRGDGVHCFGKHSASDDSAAWTIHLAIHPQINLRHAMRKRYARMQNDEIHIVRCLLAFLTSIIQPRIHHFFEKRTS
jgi:hypothetical protein